MYDKNNFFDNTAAQWESIEEDLILCKGVPDYISYQKNNPFPLIVRNGSDAHEIDGYLFQRANKEVERKYKILFRKEKKNTTKYYLLEDTQTISSQYWFTKEGVYRKSNHWGYVGNCKWLFVSAYLAAIGFCKWENFKIFKESNNA